jgi:hypothetical protein
MSEEGIYYKYNSNVDTNACVYTSQKDYDDAVKTLEEGKPVYIDDKDDKDDKDKKDKK